MIHKLLTTFCLPLGLSACLLTSGGGAQTSEIASLNEKIDTLESSLVSRFESSCQHNIEQIETELGERLATDLKQEVAKQKQLNRAKTKELKTLQTQCNTNGDDEKVIFGEVEDVTFIDEDLTLEARVDTGAETSSVGVFALTQFERDGQDWVRFKLVNLKKAPWLEYRIRDDVRIKSRVKGFTDERYEIEMDIKVGNTVYRDQIFNLANRRRFEYQALLGRSFLRDLAIVDVGVKHQLKRNAK